MSAVRWLLVLGALLAAGCGGASEPDAEGPAASKARLSLNGADAPRADQFLDAEGRTLADLGNSVEAGLQAGSATSVFTVGENRLAFGVLDGDNRFVYAPTAVYVAKTPDSPARGPYLAPADVLVTESPFRSQQAATEEDPFAAVYQATGVEMDEPGSWSVLVVSLVNGQLKGAGSELEVKRRSPVPDVGDPAPKVETDTVADDGGIEAVDTRRPTDDMHDVSFDEVVGKKPVALLFSTPQLCQSRVCGPVVDIALQLKAKYGDQVEFIHQEVYVENDPSKGLRTPLKRFGLPTEPWLFTVKADGTIASRLEGSFGVKAFDEAVQAALQS
jgi:hypothetical protein